MKINCKEIAEKIKQEIKQEVSTLPSTPKLCTIMVGDNPASATYVNNKIKVLNECNMEHEVLYFNEDVSQDTLINTIIKLNNDDKVNGIIIQLPLPKHLDEYKLTSKVSKEKDVDGFNVSVNDIYNGNKALMPCTPSGILEIFKHDNYDLTGKQVLVIGRGATVGRFMSDLLTSKNATVTTIHSESYHVSNYVLYNHYDIIISCTGKKDIIDDEILYDLYQTDYIIDTGVIREFNEETGKYKLYGDIDNNIKKELDDMEIKYTNPIGGVGLMTTCILAKNVLLAYKDQGGM